MARKKRWHHRFRHWPLYLRLIIGIPVILFGIIELFIPGPGWLFITAGLILVLGMRNRFSRWLVLQLHRLKRRYRQWRHKRKQSQSKTPTKTKDLG